MIAATSTLTDDVHVVAVADPLAEYQRNRAAIHAALERVLGRGEYVLGEEVSAFEREFAGYVGSEYAVGVASGTDAVALALKAVGVEPGDEVVTASHTALPTAAAITQVGAIPVLVDIDRRTCTLCVEAVEAGITDRTRAIVAVHLYGCPAAIGPLQVLSRRTGVPLVEDCAQAHGARASNRHVGTFGAAGAFSFYPTKNLAALGDGGIVVSDSEEIANRVRSLRQYGWDADRVSSAEGLNSRLDELQAAVLRVRLRDLDDRTRKRRAIARRYLAEEAISSAAAQLPGPEIEHAYHLFVVRTRQRDVVREALAAAGVGSGVHYARAVHQHPAYARYRQRRLCLDETEDAVQEVLSVPVHPALADDQIEFVATTLARCLEST